MGVFLSPSCTMANFDLAPVCDSCCEESISPFLTSNGPLLTDVVDAPLWEFNDNEATDPGGNRAPAGIPPYGSYPPSGVDTSEFEGWVLGYGVGMRRDILTSSSMNGSSGEAFLMNPDLECRRLRRKKRTPTTTIMNASPPTIPPTTPPTTAPESDEALPGGVDVASATLVAVELTTSSKL